MEVHTVINEKAINELRKYLIKPKIRKMIYIMSAVFVVLGILSIPLKFYTLMTVSFGGAIILMIELHIVAGKQVKIMIARIRESYNTDQVDAKLIFEDDSFKTVNLITNGELSLTYDIMSGFVETENYYTLFTKQYQLLIVDKQQFDSHRQEQFLQLMKEKMPQLFK